MASLNGVDSNGVSQEVIDRVEQFREEHHEDPIDDPTDDDSERHLLTFDMDVSQRDAEFIVECLQVLLQQESIAQRALLSLCDNNISDEAIDVFGGFLREAPCHLRSLFFCSLPPRQVRRSLAALRTNRSVKELCIHNLQDNEGASWISDLLRHKKDITHLFLYNCCFPLMQILPLLRGQPNLQSLSFDGCRISSDILLFNDPEFTQLFVNTILLSPAPTKLKSLYFENCGASLENRPLMAGFHKNTTIVELTSDHDAETRLFIDPILRRNHYLGHVHDMLGTTTLTVPPAGVDDSVIVPTIPPPCGLWATVMAKVGQGSQGGTPVFTILRNRLATWMIPPSRKQQQQNETEQQQLLLRVDDDDVSCPAPLASLQPPETTQLVTGKANSLVAAMTTDCPINAEKEQHHPRCLGQKRAAPKSDDNAARNKIPKSSSSLSSEV